MKLIWKLQTYKKIRYYQEYSHYYVKFKLCILQKKIVRILFLHV